MMPDLLADGIAIGQPPGEDRPGQFGNAALDSLGQVPADELGNLLIAEVILPGPRA